MKVYSAVKGKRNSLHLNQTIKANIQQLAALLKSSSSQTLSLSPSNQSINGEEEAINLAKQFVTNLSDPFQCMILYPLVLDCSISCQPDALFQFTNFPEELHPIFTLYLYKCTSYTSLDRNSRKMIDLFYRYINQEAIDVYDAWLSQETRKSLGEWFYTQCISSFFQLAYREKEQYTIFITNYLRFGIPYLFLCGLSVLKGIERPPQVQNQNLSRIHTLVQKCVLK